MRLPGYCSITWWCSPPGWAAKHLIIRSDQVPPGGVDARFSASLLLALDALASKSRISASSLKGLSLYSICSHSLNYRKRKQFTILPKCLQQSRLFSNARLPATDLVGLSGLELLELALKAQVGAGAGPGHLHCGQGLLPAQARHRHDVSHHQGDAAGHARQTVRGERRRTKSTAREIKGVGLHEETRMLPRINNSSGLVCHVHGRVRNWSHAVVSQ